MNSLNTCLIVIYICLTLTYGLDIIDQKSTSEAMIPQLIMLAFVNISVVTAFFSKKWYGQLLLYINFLLVGLIPLVLGVITLWLKDKRVKVLCAYVCAGIPLLLIFLPLIVSPQGAMPDHLELNLRNVFSRLIQALYWYTVYVYTSTHLHQEYEKIEKK